MTDTAPRLDLRPDHWAIVSDILRQLVPDRKVLAFGSRATWTAKDYSDLDLAILGDGPLSLDETSALAERFGESDLPFKVDLVDWARLDESFRDILRRDGVTVQIPARASDHFGPTHLRQMTIPVPPFSEQRAIAHVLGTLDDKIELNRRMNATLEAMARALFKSWFVDFDPVRAKMEGRDTGLPKEIDDLFPERLVDSELGEIPQGWFIRTLGDLCHKPQYGYTASARSEPVGPRFLRITDINKESWVFWSRVPYCEATDDELSKYRLTKGDVLIARMADPGHGVLIEEDMDAVFESYLIRFRPVEDCHARLLQYWLKSDAYWQLVRGQAAGTTRVSLNARVLSLFPMVVPPDDGVTSAFGTAVGTLRDRLVQSATEMELLIGLRDTLLPKLVSGDVRVTASEPSFARDDRPAGRRRRPG